MKPNMKIFDSMKKKKQKKKSGLAGTRRANAQSLDEKQWFPFPE